MSVLFNDQGTTPPAVTLAISQPAHALISGGILAAWAEPLPEPLRLAGAQHDVAWMDWEVSPTFDARTGRPHLFRDIGAALHAPMWERGVEHAAAAWGRRVALMVSRHGSTIYERFSDRHRGAGPESRTEDDRAARDYLGRHRVLQERWARDLGLAPDTLAREADFLACADTLSLVLCGALPPPPAIAVAGRVLTVTASSGADTYRLDPWPFGPDAIVFETEARALPPAGCFADEPAMRDWLADPHRVVVRSGLRRWA